MGEAQLFCYIMQEGCVLLAHHTLVRIINNFVLSRSLILDLSI